MVAACAGLCAGRARALSFGGEVTYSGALGPVGPSRPLCLCLYADASLRVGIGCLIHNANPWSYHLNGLNVPTYYAVAFLDVHSNERRDPDEPYEIYQDLAAPPAGAIDAAANPDDIDFAFGDENLPATATPSASPSPTATVATPTEVATPSPTSTVVAGDCDDDGTVSVAELVRAVGVALETLPVSSCTAADRDGDGRVRIDELTAALNAALNGSS